MATEVTPPSMFEKYYMHSFPFWMLTKTELMCVHVVILTLLAFVAYWTLFRIPSSVMAYTGTIMA